MRYTHTRVRAHARGLTASIRGYAPTWRDTPVYVIILNTWIYLLEN